MLEPIASFVRIARPSRLLMMTTCLVVACVSWPIAALADDPNTSVTTGIPVVDAALKILGALYVLLSAILVILPKTSAIAQFLAKIVADLKGVAPEAAAVKEATTGEMAAKMKRCATIPPPRGFANVSVVFGVTLFTLGGLAFGFWAQGCHSNPAKTACDVVNIIDDGCKTFVEVPLPDGTTEKIPREEIVKLAQATKAARLKGAP